ncbi:MULTISPECIES: hypothetical protein [Hymenobacter]|uniref:Uncharacterized protein n=1 Tax=Hymenobacter mucosus TaxID=1411120 RepID=A0A238WA27_9BACT|nr:MULTISPECIES: hypothetical protein [Hymenobacter]SNR43231.1 hypothetical protein SAMN06269173_102373 [Hymenobacter mucosus]
MDELTTLVKIVTDRRLAVLPFLDFSARNAASKDLQLVRLLEEDPNTTQNKIVKSLYGATDARSQTTFRKLKSRVQQKLLNHLYFLDHTDVRHVVSRRHEQQCLGLLHQARILLGEGEYKLAERLFRKSLKVATDAELTQYAVMCVRMLRILYAETRNAARFKAMNKQLEELQQTLSLEDEAEQLFFEIKVFSQQKVRWRQFILKQLPSSLERLEQLHKKAKTYNTFYFLYVTKMSREELTGNYAEIIRLTAATEKARKQGKVNEMRFDKRFNNYMSVYAHLQCRQAKKGLKLAEEYFKDFHYSSGNWFYYLEIYLLLAMHASQYGQAYELLQQARKNPYYRKQRPAAQQRWELYEAYIQLVQPEQSPVKMRHFAQLVQTVPDYSRDKQGYNVAILILQFLYFLRRRDIEGLLARLDGLRKYEQRHLRNPATLRSQLFFRMLLLTVKENFVARQCEQKAAPLLEKLRVAPQPGEAYGEIEIVPYEDLWAFTLTILHRLEEEQRANEQASRDYVG